MHGKLIGKGRGDAIRNGSACFWGMAEKEADMTDKISRRRR